jgi:hypothetical protein
MIVHNISDRPNTDSQPSAICIGNTLIRPGKFAVVTSEELTSKVWALHGTHIWIGALPPKFKSTSRSALRNLAATTTPMTESEALEYLRSLDREELLGMCQQVSPALTFTRPPGKAMLAILLQRALFSESVSVNPETFFWLRRWTRHGNEYEERD